jgi:WD40 repeat protein
MAETTSSIKLAVELNTDDWRVYRACFSPDSKTLVLASHNKGISIFDVGSWEMRSVPKLGRPLDHIAFSPDSASFVLPVGKDDPTRCCSTAAVLKWQLKPGSMAAAFSPDGQTLAATRSKSVLICDAATGRILHDMSGHTKRVDSVIFSSDGKRIASLGQSQVCLWDAQNGKLVAVVKEAPGEVHAILFSPDSRSLVVSEAKGMIRVYEASSGRKQHEWQAHGSHVFYLAFTSDSTRLLSQSFVGDDHSLRIWDFPGCRQIHQRPGERTGFYLSPNEQSVVLIIGDRMEIEI